LPRTEQKNHLQRHLSRRTKKSANQRQNQVWQAAKEAGIGSTGTEDRQQ
jgi:hypothetical protein